MQADRTRALLLLSCLLASCGTSGAPAQVAQGALAPEDANEARLNRLQPPDHVMDAIGLQRGMVVAEIGAGRGRYVMQLAARVGEHGRVYAEDIDRGSLQYLERRCARWGVANVATIVGDPADPKLPAETLDRIFIISSYHHFDDPVALLGRARSALKRDGRLTIGEWTSAMAGTSPGRMKKEMTAAGYRLERIDTTLEANGLNIYVFAPAPDSR
jgi:precorrin-6B methylase 2